MKNERPALVDDGMPGVRAALIADDGIGIAGQDIDDLALAFVAPLGAYDDEISHRSKLPKKWLWPDRWPGPERHGRDRPMFVKNAVQCAPFLDCVANEGSVSTDAAF